MGLVSTCCEAQLKMIQSQSFQLLIANRFIINNQKIVFDNRMSKFNAAMLRKRCVQLMSSGSEGRITGERASSGSIWLAMLYWR